MRVSTPLQYMGYNQAMLKNQTQMSEALSIFLRAAYLP